MAGTMFINGTANTNRIYAASKNMYVSSKTYYTVKGKSITFVSSFKNKKAKWSISNKKVVKVQKKTNTKLKLKAKKTGKVVITLKCGTWKRKCTLRILKNPAETATATTAQPAVSSTVQTMPEQTASTPVNTQTDNGLTTVPNVMTTVAYEQVTTQVIPGTSASATTEAYMTTAGIAEQPTTQATMGTDASVTTEVNMTTTRVPGASTGITTQSTPGMNTSVTTETNVTTTAGAPEQPTTQSLPGINTGTTTEANVTTAGVPEQPTTQGVPGMNTSTTTEANVTTVGVPEQPTTQSNPGMNTGTNTEVPEQPTTQGTLGTNTDTTTEANVTTAEAPEQPTTQDTPGINTSTTTEANVTTAEVPEQLTTQAPAGTNAGTTEANATTQEPATTEGNADATTESEYSVEEARPVTAEDLAHREASQADIPSSFTFPTYTGDGTFYGGGYTGGCCNLDSMTNGYYICALNKPDYNKSQMAGAYLKVTGPTGTLKVLVADELPEGKKGDIDFNEIAFPHVANVEDGRVPVSWTIVPFPTDEPIQYWIKKDSTSYWMQLQVRNQRYPIAKVEMLQPNGTFAELNKENYNFYTIYMPGEGPYVFRVTDINGQVLTDTIEMKPGVLIDGAANFPY